MKLVLSSDHPNYYRIIWGICPLAKPRMTQKDKWQPRPCVLSYWMYKDELNVAMATEVLPVPFHVCFLIPMPKSWSKKKQSKKKGSKHLVKPDVDNLTKGFIDALLERDQEIWDVRSTKIWWDEPAIILRSIPELNIIKEIGNVNY